MASFIPVAAIMLARRTHAPELVWLAGAAGVDPRPDRVPASHARGAALARLGHVPRAVRRLLALRPERPAPATSSASAPPSSTATATPTTRSSATTTTGPRCASPAPPASATWARSASAPLLEPEPQPALARRARSTSSRAAGYLGGGDERAAARADRRPAARRHEPRRARLRARVEADAPRLGPPGRHRRAGAGGDRLRAAARRTARCRRPPSRRRSRCGCSAR